MNKDVQPVNGSTSVLVQESQQNISEHRKNKGILLSCWHLYWLALMNKQSQAEQTIFCELIYLLYSNVAIFTIEKFRLIRQQPNCCNASLP